LRTERTVFDTSLYIAALRGPVELRLITQERQLWMSAVVLEELYAGAGSQETRTIELLQRSFVATRRLLLPSLMDWKAAGLILARVARKYGYEHIGRGRLTNDALIAVSSARLGAAVLTLNASDFARLAEFHNFQWEIARL